MRKVSGALLHLGVAATVLSLAKVHAALVGHYDLTASTRFTWMLAYTAMLAVAAYASGLPDSAGVRHASLQAVAATSAAAAAISLVQLVLGSALLPRYVVIGAVLVLAPWFVLCSVMAQGGRTRQQGRDRVLAVVSAEDAKALRRELVAAERPAVLVGSLAVADAVAGPAGGAPLVDAARHLSPSLLVLDRIAQGDEGVVAQAAELHAAGVRVRTLTMFYDEWLGKLPLSELERIGLMFDIGELHRARYGRVKRGLDVLIALPGLALLAVVVPCVLLANLVGFNRGPLLYRQPRVGRDGAPFTMLKLRSIRPGSSGGEWLDPDDPRITPVGRWLRRSHLDELPQVLNILAGDLSIVGPRPEQPAYVEELTDKIPFYDLRHRVRPGLTGWAQVKYQYADDEMGAVEKLQYEFYYLRHQSLGFDLRIIGRTLRSVVRLTGR